ncbi:MAG: hypothetical protein HRT58_10005 [Crocinitomicaceae bacterium]|nr:hypothetical protein [Flavobacteriales bacterium]NQZ35987.1 hypothetical protein [Crocinitomicaceae bacterium]
MKKYRNIVFAIKYWIKLIYPFLLMGMLFSVFVLLATWAFDYVRFQKVLPRIIIIDGTAVFLFVTYKILDFKYPFSETHNIENRRNQTDKKKWWQL